MTKRTIEWARALLISPELTAVALVIFISHYWPALARQIGSLGQFDRVDGWVLALAAAPLSLVGLTYTAATKVLRPESGRAELIAWPEYWRLRIQVFAALVWACLGAIGWIGGGLLLQSGSLVLGAAVAVSGITAAAVATATTALARLEVQDAIEGAPTGDT